MRGPRIKAKKGQDAIYHCMSRIVGGAFLLGRYEKEIFISQMWKLADYCGLFILNYCVMSNHYHQVVEVPGFIDVSDEELVKRVGTYYGPDSVERLGLQQAFEKGGDSATNSRHKYLRMMGDISVFQKILKQRFTTWYNKGHNRQGTLWMGRFKSLLVEDFSEALQNLSAYIDLNPLWFISFAFIVC